MSEETTTDILQPLSFEKWRLLQCKTKQNWPQFAYNYYWIENAIKWKEKKPDILIDIYCPYDDLEKGTFIGISKYSIYIVITFTLEPNDGLLYKALTETNVINWKEEVYFAAVHEFLKPTVYSAIEFLKNVRSLQIKFESPGNYYFQSAKECAELKVRVPEECYLKTLDKSNVHLIHSEWPHKSLDYPEESTKYLATMIELNCGVGLYLKEDNSLVSWILHNDWHGLGMVQTLAQHTRKGYAKTVSSALAKNLGLQDISVTLFIVEGNLTSETMFTNLGWRRISPIIWIGVQEQECQAARAMSNE
ncbi:glycine N-acyltransferase-like protein 3 [Augochlora pura]